MTNAKGEVSKTTTVMFSAAALHAQGYQARVADASLHGSAASCAAKAAASESSGLPVAMVFGVGTTPQPRSQSCVTNPDPGLVQTGRPATAVCTAQAHHHLHHPHHSFGSAVSDVPHRQPQ